MMLSKALTTQENVLIDSPLQHLEDVITFLNGPNPASFCLFLFFLQYKYSTNLTINDRSIDGVLGIRTQDSRVVGVDESTDLYNYVLF